MRFGSTCANNITGIQHSAWSAYSKASIQTPSVTTNEYQRFDFPQTGSKLPNLTVVFNYLNRVIRAFIYSIGTDASESYFPSNSTLVSIPFRF